MSNDLINQEVKPWMNINPYSISLSGGPYPYGELFCQVLDISVNIASESGNDDTILRLNRIGNVCNVSFDKISIPTGGATGILTVNYVLPFPFMGTNTKSWSAIGYVSNTTNKVVAIGCNSLADGGNGKIIIQTLDGSNWTNGAVIIENLQVSYNFSVL